MFEIRNINIGEGNYIERTTKVVQESTGINNVSIGYVSGRVIGDNTQVTCQQEAMLDQSLDIVRTLVDMLYSVITEQTKDLHDDSLLTKKEVNRLSMDILDTAGLDADPLLCSLLSKHSELVYEILEARLDYKAYIQGLLYKLLRLIDLSK